VSSRPRRRARCTGRSQLRARPSGDAGNAMVEFTYLAVLLMVPLVYVLLTVFEVQRAAFGVTEAARQAGRAYATADSDTQGRARAAAAASLAMRDQGLQPDEPPRITSTAGLAPDARVTTQLQHRVVLPLFGGLFRGAVPPHIPVRATHVQVVDRFKAPPQAAR
jgi:Flp pilus assembly protein TadG